VNHSSIIRRLSLAALLLLSSLLSAHAVTLLPQEQAIADYMVSNPIQGRPTLILDPVIEAVARARAQDMAVRNYFSHVNPDGVAANYLLRQAGYVLPSWWGTDPSANYVESIAAGYSDPSDTWTAWMNSPDHKTHLLGQNSFYASETHYGVGYYYDANSTYGYYWVVITAPPQPLEITTPEPAAHVTTPAITVAGTTDPTSGAASVQFRVENLSGTSAYQPATGLASWSGTAAGLISGANTIRVQSLDASSNVIAQATCKVTLAVPAALTVTTSGSGSVTSSLSGTTTQTIGRSVTIKATPAPGSIFAGWTGSITSGSAALTFTMQDGFSLQANFIPNPFGPVTGGYYGILTSGPSQQSGLVRLTLSGSGLFTGRLQFSGQSWSFTGRLDATGAATVTIPHSGTPPLVVTVQADLTGGSGQITGNVAGGTADFSYTASQSAFNARTSAAPQAGRYTLVLTPDPVTTGTSIPQGNGYAAIVVSPNGSAIVTGRLADGTAYSASGHVANDGTLAIYCVPAGSPAGSSVDGLLTFRSTMVSDIDGALTWTKRPDSRAPFYPAGFSTQLPAAGSLYVRPAAGLQPMNATPTTATVGLGDGNLAQPINVPVTLSQPNKATMVTPGLPDVTLSINPTSGAVTGSFVMPDGKVTRSVRGVIFQKQKSAFGYFRGLNQCGYFSLVQGS
jgi:uncharacterized protein YkwD